jgi:thiosulfate dehydrogenase (quinone) large subunit
MDHIAPENSVVAFTLCRVVLGVLFFAQAYDKIFNVGVKQVASTFREPLNKLPSPVVTVFSYLTSYLELIFGALLVLGLFTKASLHLLAIDMALVCVGFSMIKAMWDMQYYFPRLLLLVILLLLPEAMNKCSIDNFLFGIR